MPCEGMLRGDGPGIWQAPAGGDRTQQEAPPPHAWELRPAVSSTRISPLARWGWAFLKGFVDINEGSPCTAGSL